VFEMIEARRLKDFRVPVMQEFDAFAGLSHFANAGETYTAKLRWKLLSIARAHGKQQLEIFAAVQREVKRVVFQRARELSEFDRARVFEQGGDGDA
jgi:hypothetical protein